MTNEELNELLQLETGFQGNQKNFEVLKSSILNLHDRTPN